MKKAARVGVCVASGVNAAGTRIGRTPCDNEAAAWCPFPSQIARRPWQLQFRFARGVKCRLTQHVRSCLSAWSVLFLLARQKYLFLVSQSNLAEKMVTYYCLLLRSGLCLQGHVWGFAAVTILPLALFMLKSLPWNLCSLRSMTLWGYLCWEMHVYLVPISWTFNVVGINFVNAQAPSSIFMQYLWWEAFLTLVHLCSYPLKVVKLWVAEEVAPPLIILSLKKEREILP